MQQLVAKSISHVFGPIIVWPPLLWLLFFRTRGWVSDMVMTNVRERRGFFFLMIFFHAASVVLLWQLTSLELVWQSRLIAWVIEVAGASSIFLMTALGLRLFDVV